MRSGQKQVRERELERGELESASESGRQQRVMSSSAVAAQLIVAVCVRACVCCAAFTFAPD